jgi:hypothetical protein
MSFDYDMRSSGGSPASRREEGVGGLRGRFDETGQTCRYRINGNVALTHSNNQGIGVVLSELLSDFVEHLITLMSVQVGRLFGKQVENSFPTLDRRLVTPLLLKPLFDLRLSPAGASEFQPIATRSCLNRP